MIEQPLVSLILPIRNEARYITRCLEAVCAQDYPKEKIEILVVDGMSSDGTCEIVMQFAACDPRVQLLDNPQQIVPTALNRGISAAHGQIIIRVDGHAVIAPDYVRRCVEAIQQVGAECVGGPIHTVGETWLARGIALAQSSPFGVGNAAFRTQYDKAGYVDTVAFGAYQREVFARIGWFDEEMIRNQDDEFNYRLTQAGGKIYMDPSIRSTYFSRATLKGLWKQYYQYGFYKVRLMQKRRGVPSWRHLVPGAFVLLLISSALFGLLARSLFLFAAIMLIYFLVSLAVSCFMAARNGWRYVSLLPLAFMTLHIGYGLGFLAGLLHFGLRKQVRSLVSARRWMS